MERLETKQPNVKLSGSDFLYYIPEFKKTHEPTNKKQALLKETLNHVLIFSLYTHKELCLGTVKDLP